MAECELAHTEPVNPSSGLSPFENSVQISNLLCGSPRSTYMRRSPMYETLAHTKYMCKYDVVFIPKYRKKALFKDIRPWLINKIQRACGAKKLSN